MTVTVMTMKKVTKYVSFNEYYRCKTSKVESRKKYLKRMSIHFPVSVKSTNIIQWKAQVASRTYFKTDDALGTFVIP